VSGRFRVEEPEPTDGVVDVAAALNRTIAAARLASELATHEVPVMILKGAPVQQRLLGSESAYPSADIDLLIHQRHGRFARSLLEADGWCFLPENGMLWRIDQAAAYERRGVVIDLHWGLHTGALLSWTMRPLERALWEGAQRVESGWWEPRPEPLIVYLCLHAAAFGFSKPAGLRLVAGAAPLVEDWGAVEGLSRRLGAWPTVSHALDRAREDATGSRPPLLVGARGRLVWGIGMALRGRPLPGPARRPVDAVRRWRTARRGGG